MLSYTLLIISISFASVNMESIPMQSLNVCQREIARITNSPGFKQTSTNQYIKSIGDHRYEFQFNCIKTAD